MSALIHLVLSEYLTYIAPLLDDKECINHWFLLKISNCAYSRERIFRMSQLLGMHDMNMILCWFGSAKTC